jgi:hypothetical protein
VGVSASSWASQPSTSYQSSSRPRTADIPREQLRAAQARYSLRIQVLRADQHSVALSEHVGVLATVLVRLSF